MNQMAHSPMPIAQIRAVATRFDAEAIETCIQLALKKKDNPCYDADGVEEIMLVLAKVKFVRNKMEQGTSLAEAIRELGKRIRSFQISHES